MADGQETQRAAAAFHEYCLLGPSRSLAKVGQKWGKSGAYVGQLEKWSSAYHWVERAKDYDAERQREEEELRKQQRAEDERHRREDLDAVRLMLLRHVNAQVEPSSTSQIQAGKLLTEHYIVAGDIAQVKEALQLLQEKLKAAGIET